MNIRYIFTWVLMLLTLHSYCQNAPVTAIATIPDATPGGEVVVPVTVNNFTNIGSVTLSLDYDYTKLHFISGEQNPLLLGNFSIGDNDLGNGIHRIIIGWYGAGTTLSDGSCIVSYRFTFVSGSALLQWFEIGPSCEYTDFNSNILNDTPTSTYYINGIICSEITGAGPMTGSDTICQGQTNIGYSINPLYQTTSYLWSVPSGAVITEGGNTNSILVNYSDSATSGLITVSTINECGEVPVASLPVTVHPVPAVPVIVQIGTSLVSNMPTGNQWYYENEPIPEANYQTFSPIKKGKYFDIVTTNGCVSDTSNILDVSINSIPETDSFSGLLYPNPAKDHFFIKISGPSDEIIGIKVFSSYGRFLKNYEISGGPFFKELRIETNPFPPGVYFIEINKRDKVIVSKLILLK